MTLKNLDSIIKIHEKLHLPLSVKLYYNTEQIKALEEDMELNSSEKFVWYSPEKIPDGILFLSYKGYRFDIINLDKIDEFLKSI